MYTLRLVTMLEHVHKPSRSNAVMIVACPTSSKSNQKLVVLQFSLCDLYGKPINKVPAIVRFYSGQGSVACLESSCHLPKVHVETRLCLGD